MATACKANYGLVTDARGCPVAVSVHAGNTSDSTTFMPEVQRLRTDFGNERMVMVGDRGMISQKDIAQMRDSDGIGAGSRRSRAFRSAR
ncbi:MAG: transposase [Sterolibacteriaceae bacterium]|nr:transposase [Sterolibacteriaceae bacterium]